MDEITDYKTELKEFLQEQLDKKDYEIFEVTPGILIRYKKKGSICFKFSNVGMMKMLKKDLKLTKEKVFDDFLSDIKNKLSDQFVEIENLESNGK